MAKDNLTEPARKSTAKTKIVSGTAVKITRARSGSMGKEIEEDVIERPDEDWLDEEILNDPAIAQGRQTGYGKWVENIGNPLRQVEETDDISTLPELLTSEHPVVQDAAEGKLRALNEEIAQAITNGVTSAIKSKEETPKSRFDVIDIPEEEKE